MISSFSSFLEFMAAVYTSMYFDRVFDFWSPKYKKQLNATIEANNWTNDKLFTKTLRSASNDWYAGVRKLMLNRAIFMILSIISILIFIGYEDNRQFESSFYTSFVITWSFCLFFIVLLFNKFFFLNVKRVFVALMIEFLVFWAATMIVPSIPSIEKWGNYCKQALLLFTISPAIIQIFISWLSSTPYSEYIKKSLPNVKCEYDLVQKSLETQDASLIPEEFKTVITNMFVRGASYDTSMVEYQKILKKKMLRVCQPKCIFVVFWSWIVFQRGYFIRVIVKHGTEKQVNNVVYEMPKDINPIKIEIDYALEYKKYKEEKMSNRGLNIRNYCKLHNLPVKPMINWVKTNNPSF